MTLWRDIIENLTDPIIVLSGQLELRAINPAAEALLGATSSSVELVTELLKRNRWLEKMIAGCLVGGKAASDARATLEFAGSATAVAAEVSPLLAQDGEVHGAIVLLHNRARQLHIERSFETAAESNLGMSPAGLAHEIKNPLTAIKGAAELLLSLFRADERARQYCELILNGVNRIAGLIEQVMSVSAPQKLKSEPVNIHKVLHQALTFAGLHPKNPPLVKIEQYFDPSLPCVLGDEPALVRIFLNLVKNAYEAIGGSGTIRLVTRMETDFRRTTGGRQRRFLRVEISDSGAGMHPEEMAQLFKPFFTTKPSGTGLGLVLSQRTVALMGGKLWAEPGRRLPGGATAGSAENELGDSAPLSGMTFKVTLPVIIAPCDYSPEEEPG